MRLLMLVPAAILLVAAAPVTVKSIKAPLGAKPMCRNSEIIQADGGMQDSSIHLLGDEPPAQHISAVLRTINGCEKPVVINAEVGARRR